MGKDYHLTQMYMPFYAACIATVIGFLFFFLSFSSPYWLQSYDRVHSNFLHMGIWSVCFDRFVHPLDYHANVLTGCYWIFDRFFFTIGIWQWLDPYWLIAVQVLITVAFITQCCVILIIILYHLLFGHPAAESTMAMFGQLFIAVLLSVSAITFGIKSQDRSWMPRPDQNFLSWSFGFVILAAISSYISAGFLYCVSYTDRAAQEEVERFEAAEKCYGLQSTLSGRGASASAYGRSIYGGSQSVGGVVVKVPSTGNRPEQVLTLDSDLRRTDGGDGSASLFTSSLVQQSISQQQPPGRSGVGVYLSSVPEDDDHHPLVASPDESQTIESYRSEGSERRIYANVPYNSHLNETRSRRPPPGTSHWSDERDSYSPIEETEVSDQENSDIQYSRYGSERSQTSYPRTASHQGNYGPRTTNRPRY